jgi:hypothetical protein
MDVVSLIFLLIFITVPVVAVVALVKGIKRLFTPRPAPAKNRRSGGFDGITVTISHGDDDDSDDDLQPPEAPPFVPRDNAFQPAVLRFPLGDLPYSLDPISVPSGGYNSQTYQLDIGTLGCTCQSGQIRSQFPARDARRICHHLMPYLRNHGLIHGGDHWAQVLIDQGEGAPLDAWTLRLNTAPPILITRGTSPLWLNIFARSKRPGERIAQASGPIERYGWSLLEKRWSYGEGPPGAGEARRLIIAATG